MSETPVRRLGRSLIRLYPPTWRARYAAEALDLLDVRAPTWGDLGNLAYHVLYTWLHPDLLAAKEGSAERAGGTSEAHRPSQRAAPR
jgi:hypothetical protein